MPTIDEPTNFDIVSEYVRLSYEASSTLGTEENLRLGDFFKINKEKLVAIESEAKKGQPEWVKLSLERRQELIVEAASRLDGDTRKYMVLEGSITERNLL